MIPLLNQPELVPIPGTELYVFASEFRLALPVSRRMLVVSPGFTSDGASIPRFLWSIIGHPFDPNFVAPAAGAHDPLYAAELLARADCDRELRALMLLNGKVAVERAPEFFFAVRAFGWWRWRRHSPRSVAQARLFCRLEDLP